ncbi:hypothetical protein KKG45_11860 [bacterium]|nr:hypothetical protein [bacterium]MBU1073932.1 hypothetical protein [bacterium]MBU1676723.1 hypothetical protein [bacterium]
MQRLLLVLLTLCLASWAIAGDDGATRITPQKGPAQPGLTSFTPYSREGGEDIGTAIAIASLPFSDTGYTCDNIDDYDEVCNFAGSVAQDVAYSYAPAIDEVVALDLCYSSYDTKVYVYDAFFNVMGCNDDFYYGDPPECYTYSSYLRILLPAGETYYIVVDGYGTECGDYNLDVAGMPYEPLECDINAQPEGEPTLVPEYVDNHNGGCNSTPEVFQPLNWIDEDSGCMHLSGISGWYPAGGVDNRDTDWYEFVAASDAITVALEVENWMTPTRCMMTTANPSCGGYDYSFQSNEVVSLQPMSWTVPTTIGATYWIFVAPYEWVTGYTGEFAYCLEVCGNSFDIVPNEDASWGAVKSIYR